MNNAFRCIGLFVVVLLGACDSQEAPVPKPKVEASAVAPVSPPVQPLAAPDSSPAVHELKPPVPVVPVVAGKPAAPARPVAKSTVPRSTTVKVSSEKAVSAKPAPAKAKKEKIVAQREKKKPAKSSVKDVRLSQPKLDLTLPPEMVQKLSPPANVITAKRKPLLPPMFESKRSASDPSPFELNGRLLSNEMQLQMRNESRRDIEGAALDFKFKQ
ncbi:translation initiation factor 2 [Pseudomonas sp. NPDC089734]|uniref:translation initiation factor 2 n=1 Tax=Pseudomonas sp. NPDC089734 TaxID=3364469 RepID=UPI0037F4773D